MSYLDGVFSESGADPEIITAIQSQLAAQQAVINGQQAAIDDLQATDSAQTTIDALQQAAIDAQAALNTAQQAAIGAVAAANDAQTIAIALAESTNDTQTARLTALEALEKYDGLAPVDRFVPGWPNTPLDSGNFDAALRAAKAWCYEQVVPNGTFAFNVGLPAGLWPTTRATLDFPGTYLIIGSPPTPGMVGPGSGQCVLDVLGTGTAGVGMLTLGADTYTRFQTLKGFRVRARDAVGIGIRAVCTFKLTIEDVRVDGFNVSQHFDSGWGIAFEQPSNVLDQHQHVTLRSVSVDQCQSGIKLTAVAQLTADDVWVNQCMWLSHTYDGVLGASFTGGNLQGSDNLVNNGGTHWYGQTLHPECATGWSRTTGLPGGSAATLSTTTYVTDPDTGIAGVGTCVVGGLTGITLDAVGNWITLQAASGTPYVSDDRVAGIYQILEYISPTSVRILKGTTHTAKTAVTWQMRGTAGGNFVSVRGFPYHEGARRCVFFFGPDLVADSVYSLDGVLAFNTMALIANGRVGQVRLHSSGGGVDKVARLTLVNQFTTDVRHDRVVMDGWSRQGTVARATDLYLTSGTWEGARSPAARLNSFVTERGGWSFDPARIDKHTLSTLNITQVRSVQDDAITLAPQYVGSPPAYVVSDAGFDGPCWNLQGGATGATRNLNGSIPAAKLPSTPYSPTLLVVARLPNTTVDPDAVRRMMLRANDGTRDMQVAFNDGAFYAGGNYFAAYSATLGGSGSVRIRSAVDTDPHAYAVRWEMRGNGLGGAMQGTDELSGGAEFNVDNIARENAETFPGAMDMLLWFLHDFGNGNAGLLVRWVGVLPAPLGSGEIEQWMDMTAFECGVSR